MRYMTIKYLILALAICSYTTAFAQGQTVASSINEIKRQPDRFIFAENTAPSFDEADANARTILTDAIFNALDPSTPDRVETAVRLASMATPLSAKRGNLSRIFLYLDREMLNMDKETSAVNTEVTEPMVTQQDVWTPAQEINEPDKYVQIPDTGMEPTQMNLPEETIIELTLPEEETETKADPIAQKMLDVSLASDIENFVRTLKSNGEISKFGRLKDIPASGKIYIFIFDKNNEVVAKLVKEGDNTTDIISGKPREINEFKGCGCIWMK